MLIYIRQKALIAFLFFTQLLYSQTWNWIRSFGGIKSDKAIAIRVDKDENVIVAGYYAVSAYMGNGITLTSTGTSKQVYIAKYDRYGICQWAKDGGNGLDDRVLGMDLDSAGNIYITGTSWSSVSIGSISLNSIPGCCDNCFVIKLDKNGNWIWGNSASSTNPDPSTTIHYSGDDQGLDIVTDDAGNSYVVGFLTGNQFHLGNSGTPMPTANLGPNVCNYFIGKIDASGKWHWGKTFGNLPFDPTLSIPKYVERDIAVCLDSAKNIYVTGGFDGTRNFGSTVLTSKGGHDVFLMKMDTAGNILWAKSGGSHKDDWANGVSADGMGHVYVTGEHRDSLLFDTTLIKNYDKRDVFVAKFDGATGNSIWGKRAGCDVGGERGNDVYADNKCNVYVVGEAGPNAKFGRFNIDSNGSTNVFVARISPDGDWMWVTNASSTDSNDRGNSISVGKNHDVYISGFYETSTTFGNVTVNSNGRVDAYIARILDLDSITSCEKYYADTLPKDTTVGIYSQTDISRLIRVFPNPANSILNIDVENAMQATLFDLTGSLVLTSDQKRIDVSKLREGVYLLVVIVDGISYNYKVIKM